MECLPHQGSCDDQFGARNLCYPPCHNESRSPRTGIYKREDHRLCSLDVSSLSRPGRLGIGLCFEVCR